MRVVVDETVLREEPNEFARALDAAREQAEVDGRVIIEVRADGQPVPDAWLDDPACAGGPIQELHLLTADPASLVRTTFLDAADLLDQAREDQQGVAQHVQSGRIEDALQGMVSVIQAWTAVRDAVESGSGLLGLDLSRTGSGKPASELIPELATTLDEVRRCLGDSDWSSLGDALAYDLPEHADAWQAMLRSLADQVSGSAGGTAPKPGPGA